MYLRSAAMMLSRLDQDSDFFPSSTKLNIIPYMQKSIENISNNITITNALKGIKTNIRSITS